MSDPTFIQFQATQEDKQLLIEIARRDGNSSLSAAMRRIIRQEAERRGIAVSHSNESASRG